MPPGAEDGPLLGGRFRVLRLLKEGSGISTFAGLDLRTGDDVVVKTVQAESVPPATRLRLEHEADVLARLRSGAVGSAASLGQDDGVLYLVQPYVAGVPLDDRLRRGPLSVQETLHVASHVLEALELAHDHGVVHRDIKPANVIVNADDPVHWAVVIDFGLARSTRLDASVRDQPVGTVRYMAPEQAGLLDAPVDERSDLYSVGAVLFECLAGRPPFDGDQVGEVLRMHLTAPVPELRAMGVALPRALDDFVQRLLRKDPNERYQTAAGARADVAAISAGLRAGVTEPPVVVGAADRRHNLTEPAFVGRERELATLSRHLDATAGGGGGLVLLEAESGGGKTRLLEELARNAAQRGFRVFRGQAVDQASQRPYQLLDGVAAGVRARPDHVAAELREWLGDASPAVVAAIPALADVLGHPAGDLGPEAYGEERSLHALVALLDALGRPGRPAVVLLDDCQWADGLTVTLLRRWSARLEVGSVLVVAAFRSEEVGRDHALRAASGRQPMVLPPFGGDEVANLAESMAGPLPDDAVVTLVRLADGSPFMAAAVLRGMVESGALVDGANGWETDAVAMAEVQTSRRAATFLTRRMELLSPAALALLSVGAVLGKEFDLALAAELAGQGGTEAVPALDEARRRRIVWVDDPQGRVVFSHDKLRESLLARLATGDRRRLHQRAAERIRAVTPERVFDLAFHFDAAGDGASALPFALEAAAQARAQHALEVAEAQYRIAERAAADDDTRRRVAEGLGEVLSLRGSYEEAATQLRVARDLAPDRRSAAQLDWRLGEVAFRKGDVVDALAALTSALG